MENLFEYAKKELTQDAVIAWLLESKLGKSFLLDMCPQLKADIGEKTIEKLDVSQQAESIDILVEVSVGEETVAVIIEDKVDTYLHDFQMLKYIKKIASKCKNRKKKYKKVYFLLFKTGDMHYWEVKDYEYWQYQINNKKRGTFNPKDEDMNQRIKGVLVSNWHIKSKIEFTSSKKPVGIHIENVYTLKQFQDFLNNVNIDDQIFNYYRDYLNARDKQIIGTDTEKEYCLLKNYATNNKLHLEVVKANGGGKREYEYNLISKAMIIGEENASPRFLILPIIVKSENGEYKYVIQCQLVTQKETIHGYVPWSELNSNQKRIFSDFKESIFNEFKDKLVGWTVNQQFSKYGEKKDEADGEIRKNNGLKLCDFHSKEKEITEENVKKLIETAKNVAKFVEDNYQREK